MLTWGAVQRQRGEFREARAHEPCEQPSAREDVAVLFPSEVGLSDMVLCGTLRGGC